MKNLSRFLIVLLLHIIAGCQPVASPKTTAQPTRITIFAAASTTEALEEFVAVYGPLFPNADIAVSFAASSTLANQIDQGAAADIFLSANDKWADFLEENGHVAEQVNLLGNSLVLIQRRDADHVLTDPQGLLDERIKKIAIADSESVPAGIYAREALTKLNLWDELQPKLVAGADVRQTLAFVETGAVDAGVVYSTDAAASDDVVVCATFDAGLTEPIVYPLVLLKRGAAIPVAREFYEILKDTETRGEFLKHGFTAPP